ncbi:MAG: disulfide bond formation protein B [Xanthomonadales bacterium]|jgi:Disulfide bond formation protein DsbB|nr:disulfide bond formation protein B [Xanthomonadaceae bacterium]MBN8223568.1 disulfide bond formation protein B [Xanthomonadales bacterium]MCA0198834.1 disulfide bond formation protein B [Pseudomonadota bacterium]HRF82850.1 disulfide bond formation protein B [Pseudoxanthomonas sp.]
MNPFRWNFRAQFLAGFLGCVALVAYAIYTQLYQGLEPCPLCIFQRIAYAALALVFLAGFLHGPRSAGGRRAYGVLVLIAAAVGIGIAGRHVWLQTLPKDLMPSCGPPLSFLRETMGPLEVVRKVLTGSGNCGDVDWTMLGLSMPAWSLIGFVLLAFWGLFAAFRRRKGRGRH